MRSRTSSSKWTILRKDLTRFAPVWIAWSAMYLIGGYLCYDLTEDLTYRYSAFLPLFNILNAIYGISVAMSLFGYLHDPRECVTVHAFPLRREQYFLIHAIAGLLMHLIPTGLFCLAVTPQLGQGPVILYTGMVLQFVFYFGLGIFCMMLTGRRFAAGILYVLLNFLSPLVYLAIDILYMPMLPGIEIYPDNFYLLSPPIAMMFRFAGPLLLPDSAYIADNWHYMDWPEYIPFLGVFAAIGAGLMILALVLYQYRKLESAGDFIAVKWLQPVFVLAITLAFGCVGAVFGNLFLGNYVFMLAAAMVVGYFAAQMLIRRTARVFDLKTLAGFGCIAVLVMGSLGLTRMDVLGRVDYVPETDSVARVEVYSLEGTRRCYFTSDPNQIAQIASLHTRALNQDTTDENYMDSERLELKYYLKNGSVVKRYYLLGFQDLVEEASWYFSQPEYLFGTSGLEDILSRLESAEINGYKSDYSVWEQTYYLDQTEIRELLPILYEEACAGLMSTTYYDYIGGYEATNIVVTLCLQTEDGEINRSVNIPYKAANTLAWVNAYLETVQ